MITPQVDPPFTVGGLKLKNQIFRNLLALFNYESLYFITGQQ